MIELRDKKILVTGGAGFLGAHVVRKLRERGVPRNNIFVPRSRECDLRRLESCERAVKGYDFVIHLAGITGNTEFHRQHPAAIFYDNLMMGVGLMEAARNAGVQKFITIGSATEYPEHARVPFKESDLWLGFPERVHAPYTIAKKMLAAQAAAYREQYGFNAIHLLLTNIYGPGEKLQSTYVIPTLIKRVWEARRQRRNFIEVWGTGRPTRDFLYVEDAAEGILLALERYDKPEPVNLGSGWEVSIDELARLICRLMEFDGEIRYDASKPDGEMRRFLDATLAEKEFGFKALTDFQTGLQKTIADYVSRLESS